MAWLIDASRHNASRNGLAYVQMLSHRHASGLTLVPYLEPSISQVALPPLERHGTPRTRPTRTGRQQQGRAPNQDKIGARPAAAAVAGPGDEGATLYWLVIVNERMPGWGGGGRWMLMLACSYALGRFGTFGGRYLSVPCGFKVMPGS